MSFQFLKTHCLVLLLLAVPASAHLCNSSLSDYAIGSFGLRGMTRDQCYVDTTYNTSMEALNTHIVELVAGAGINVMAPPYDATCDGTTDDTVAIAAALAAADTSNATVVLPSYCAVSSTLLVGAGVTLSGRDRNSSGLVALSPFTGSRLVTNAGHIRDMNIDMTATNSLAAIVATGVADGLIDNVAITYTSGAGTADAITVAANTPRFEVRNVSIFNPGRGLNYEGNETATGWVLDNVLVENPQTDGIRFARTTSADIGEVYLQSVRVGNPLGRSTAKGIVITSTQSGTQMPFFGDMVVADNFRDGPGLDVENVHGLTITNGWFATSASQPAIKLTAVTGFNLTLGRLISGSRGVELNGSIASSAVRMSSIAAPYGVYIDAAATLTNVPMSANVWSTSTALTNDPEKLAGAAGAEPSFTNGAQVWTRTGVGASAALVLFNANTGTATPYKRMRVNGSGDLEILDSVGTSVLWTLTDGGLLASRGAVPSAQTIGAGGTINADACGGIKRISSAGAVVTSTTNTFTAPGTSNTGCVMEVVNSGANQIDLDINSNFDAIAADDTGSDGDIDLAAGAVVRVASDGVIWRQLTRVAN